MGNGSSNSVKNIQLPQRKAKSPEISASQEETLPTGSTQQNIADICKSGEVEKLTKQLCESESQRLDLEDRIQLLEEELDRVNNQNIQESVIDKRCDVTLQAKDQYIAKLEKEKKEVETEFHKLKVRHRKKVKQLSTQQTEYKQEVNFQMMELKDEITQLQAKLKDKPNSKPSSSNIPEVVESKLPGGEKMKLILELSQQVTEQQDKIEKLQQQIADKDHIVKELRVKLRNNAEYLKAVNKKDIKDRNGQSGGNKREKNDRDGGIDKDEDSAIDKNWTNDANDDNWTSVDRWTDNKNWTNEKSWANDDNRSADEKWSNKGSWDKDKNENDRSKESSRNTVANARSIVSPGSESFVDSCDEIERDEDEEVTRLFQNTRAIDDSNKVKKVTVKANEAFSENSSILKRSSSYSNSNRDISKPKPVRKTVSVKESDNSDVESMSKLTSLLQGDRSKKNTHQTAADDIDKLLEEADRRHQVLLDCNDVAEPDGRDSGLGSAGKRDEESREYVEKARKQETRRKVLADWNDSGSGLSDSDLEGNRTSKISSAPPTLQNRNHTRAKKKSNVLRKRVPPSQNRPPRPGMAFMNSVVEETAIVDEKNNLISPVQVS